MESHRDFANVPVLWEPKEGSGQMMRKFMKTIEEKYGVRINDYWDIHKWSVENIAEFWEEIWILTGVIYSKPFDKVIDLTVPMYEPQEWFSGARMNFAENLLKYRDDHIAIISAGEDKETEKVTYAEMYEECKLYAAALRKQGVKKGDRISCYMSNRKEAVFAMIGTTSIGAIWLGVVPLMGSKAVLNRFEQVEPKILFSVDRYSYDREEKDVLPKLKEITDGLPSLEKVIIVASKPESKLKDISGIRNSCFLDDFLANGKDADGSVPEMEFEQVPLSHPIFITHTSGTTGLPKPLVHGSGALLSISRDLWLHSNSDRKNVWLSRSPVGWASWNLLTTIHFLGMTVVIFEGVPYFLSPTFLWDMVDEFEISNLFLTPSVLDDLEKKGCLPTKRNHLNSLKIITSGSIIVQPRHYDFVYKKIKTDIIFSSAYGSTEQLGFYMMLDQTLRIHRGEITSPSLGVCIQCVDDAGNALLGEIGELVLSRPTPSLLLGLWGDTDRSLFKKMYFEKYPDKFSLKDMAIINPVTRGIIICGRSDDTLKPRGYRLGSTDIYSIVDTFQEVRDSLCVSQYNQDKDERAVLFLKMMNGHLFNENLVKRIRAAIAKELPIELVPEVILEAVDIPHNMNGKKMEIIVKKIINKMPFNSETVINPECLDNFVDLPQLRGYYQNATQA